MSWGCQKFHFREFSVSCSQTSSCARKPLVLRQRCIVYTSMWQVSSGLKEDEMGSQTPHYVRGGCKTIIFDLSRSLAPKLALVPSSSSFNPNETSHIHSYIIYLYCSISGFLAQELVWEQETENDRKYFFAPPSDIVGGLATHLILFQS